MDNLFYFSSPLTPALFFFFLFGALTASYISCGYRDEKDANTAPGKGNEMKKT